jgi:hypothetical protein
VSDFLLVQLQGTGTWNKHCHWTARRSLEAGLPGDLTTCHPQPEWDTLADLQPQPIVFQSVTCNKPQDRLAYYNNAHSRPEEWNPEQESQESENEGEMLSLTGFSPADSNINVEMENHRLRRRIPCLLVGEIKCISDLESHHSDREPEYPARPSPLQHRFVSYRPILSCDSSGWHGKS